MITFHIERFVDVYAEMYPLLVEHYEEISQHREHGVPLDPQVDVYQSRENAGNLLMVIARDAGRIVGYFIGIVAPALHYKSCLSCSPDIFYVQREYRRDGTAAAMFGHVEKELRRRGVKVWMVGSKHAHNVTQLFEHLSFEPFEITYAKWIGED
ncbi:GNAT family N-acetyltransferase [Paraburkholderia caribensis]|uniref:GNAT family N-acetyltransferase n=1 Tax=Paraburkholderia caribensis TaxID=75105 RepID=UPI0034D2AA52